MDKKKEESIPEPAKEQVLTDQTVQALSGNPLIEEVPLEKNNKKLYIFGSIFFVIIILASGLVFYFVNQVKPRQKIVTKLIQNKEPIKQEIIQLKKNEITLEILNGSEIPGLASKTAKKFTDLGYQVVKTGNAETVSNGFLYVNNTLSGRLDLLVADVASVLNIASVSGTISNNSSASAQIILGKK